MAEKASGRAFVASWRNERGDVMGTTYAGTMCERPRKPWRIRFFREDFEGVIPCGECSGCLEFQRQRMADRLHAKYSVGAGRSGSSRRDGLQGAKRATLPSSPSLFVIRVYQSLEERRPIWLNSDVELPRLAGYQPDPQVRLSHKLHRRRGLQLEPGMWRLGATSFALISLSRSPLSEVLKRLGVRHRIEPLRLGRGRRAWRVLTAGLTVAREIYGEQRNRWYARGLPPAERQKWEVRKIGEYKSYDRKRSPRAWKGRILVLVPPEVWQLRGADRHAVRGILIRQSDPEGVARVMRVVADAIRGAGHQFDVSAAAKPRLTRDEVVRWYQESARRKKARTALPESLSSIAPSSGEGAYVSSEHKQGELMPQELARARRKEWEEARKRKAIKDSMEIIERMRRKSRGGQGDEST